MIGLRLCFIGIHADRVPGIMALFDGNRLLHPEITRCKMEGHDEKTVDAWFEDSPLLPLAKLNKCELNRKHGTFTVEVHLLAEILIHDVHWLSQEKRLPEMTYRIQTGSQALKIIYNAMGAIPQCNEVAITEVFEK